MERHVCLNNQGFPAPKGGRPPTGADPLRVGADVTPFPRSGLAPIQGLAARLPATRRRLPPVLIAAEQVTSLLVDLPVAGPRRRDALLSFAVEDRIAQPIDTVAVLRAPLNDPAAGPTRVLALAVSRRVVAAAAAEAPAGAVVLPEFFAISRPEAEAGAPVWSAWRDGGRVVVRVSDGTGFAVATDALASLWSAAGKPTLLSLGAALPAGLPARDLSQTPPPPDPRDLAFSLRPDPAGGTVPAALRPLRTAAVVVLVGLATHLALAVADLGALRRIAGDRRAVAQGRVDAVLPGVQVTPQAGPILSRLSPTAATTRGSDFLPLLADVSAALLAKAPSVTFRHLAFGADDGMLAVQLQGSGLDDLQATERVLKEAGFNVTSGTATAGDGGAEVDLRIARGGGG